MFDISNLKAMQVGLASPETIRSWSHGEVTRPETINYRSQKPEMGGLFCEKIFGPAKDYECHCGRYKKVRYQGITCEKCGVEVISKEWRRERFGHIELTAPCTHIWYLKGIPSRMALILDVSPKALEEVVYYASHIVLNSGTSNLKKKQILDEKDARVAFTSAIEAFKDTLMNESDKEMAESLIEKLSNEKETFDFFTTSAFIHKHTGAEFGEGAAAIKQLLSEVHLEEEASSIKEEIRNCSGEQKSQKRAKLAKRLEAIQAFIDSKQKPEWMVLDVIPVIPPDLRPMLQLDGGRFAASDLNDLYRRVISRNTRLKKLVDMHAPYVIVVFGVNISCFAVLFYFQIGDADIFPRKVCLLYFQHPVHKITALSQRKILFIRGKLDIPVIRVRNVVRVIQGQRALLFGNSVAYGNYHTERNGKTFFLPAVRIPFERRSGKP